MLQSRNVSTEVNTVFQNLVGVLDQIDPAKLNAVLTALAEGVRGQGERIGQATTDANQVLLALNPRSETVRADWQVAQGLQRHLRRCSTGHPDDAERRQHDQRHGHQARQAAGCACCSTPSGCRNSGIDLLAPNQHNLINAVNVLEPTTNLLMKYNPEYTCLLRRREVAAGQRRLRRASAATARTIVLDAALLSATTRTATRRTCPIVGAKGGPGGKPGCGSLPDVAKNFPVRQLVTNTGWGTGVDCAAQPRHRLPVLRQLPAGHPCGARTAEHPQPVRRARTRPDPVPRCPALRRAAVRTGRHAAVAGPAAGTAAGRRGIRAEPGSEPFVVPCPALQPTPLPPIRYRSRRTRTVTIRPEPTEKEDSRERQSGRRRRGVSAIFVVVCLLGMFALFAVFAQLRFGEKSQTYNAEFTNVSGLENGDFVRIAGVEVGKVKNISIQHDTHGAGRVHRRRLGGADRGQPGRDPLRQPDRRPLSGTARRAPAAPEAATRATPSRWTAPQPALDLDALIGGFRPLFRALDPDQVNALSGQLISAFQGQGATIGSFLTQTAALTNTLADRDQLIGQVIVNLNTVLGRSATKATSSPRRSTRCRNWCRGWRARKTDISNGVAYTNAAAGSDRRSARPGPPAVQEDRRTRPTGPQASWSPTTSTSTTCSTRCRTRTRCWAGRASTATTSASTSATWCSSSTAKAASRCTSRWPARAPGGARRDEVLLRTQPVRHRRRRRRR